MPTTSKRNHMLEEVTEYHHQQKRARFQHMVSELFDDLPSSDTQSNVDASESSSLSSSSSISSLSSASVNPGSPSSVTHLGYGTSDSEDMDSDGLQDKLFEQGDARIRTLTIRILTARILELYPPVKKLSQLDLYLIEF